MPKARRAALDLGTYNSMLVAEGPDGKARILYPVMTAQGKVIPSFLQYDTEGRVLRFGEDARKVTADVGGEGIVWGFKRLLGKEFVELKQDSTRLRFPFELRQTTDGTPFIQIGKMRKSVFDIYVDFLTCVRELLERQEGPDVTEITVTHPAKFNDTERRLTMEAGQKAGFAAVSLAPEPVAAALAYGQMSIGKDAVILCVDWGAGTLDLVVGMYGRSGFKEVMAPRGDPILGGVDMDNALMAHLLGRDESLRPLREEFEAIRKGERPSRESGFMTGFRMEVERLKLRLSTRTHSSIEVVLPDGKLAEVEMTREELEMCLGDLLKRAEEIIRNLVQEVGADTLDYLCLVGGPMHIPCVRTMLRRTVAGNDRLLSQLDKIEEKGFPVDPSEAVALGALLYEGGGAVPYDYGVLVGELVRYVLHRDVHRYPVRSDPVIFKGLSGPTLPVSLICRQFDDQTNAPRYFRMGDFRFWLSGGPEGSGGAMSSVCEADPLGLIGLSVQDVRSKEAMNLEQVNRLRNEEISRPLMPEEAEERDDQARAMFFGVLLDSLQKRGGLSPAEASAELGRFLERKRPAGPGGVAGAAGAASADNETRQRVLYRATALLQIGGARLGKIASQADRERVEAKMSRLSKSRDYFAETGADVQEAFVRSEELRAALQVAGAWYPIDDTPLEGTQRVPSGGLSAVEIVTWLADVFQKAGKDLGEAQELAAATVRGAGEVLEHQPRIYLYALLAREALEGFRFGDPALKTKVADLAGELRASAAGLRQGGTDATATIGQCSVRLLSALRDVGYISEKVYSLLVG